MKGHLKKLLIISLLAAALAIFFIWTRVETIKYSYEITRAERTYRELQCENEKLRVELATLRSPARIEHIARSILGLRPPAKGQIRWTD